MTQYKITEPDFDNLDVLTRGLESRELFNVVQKILNNKQQILDAQKFWNDTKQYKLVNEFHQLQQNQRTQTDIDNEQKLARLISWLKSDILILSEIDYMEEKILNGESKT